MKRNKASYVGGAAALLVSSVTVKILGALFKIPLTNLIGDSGMGLFAFAMQFFSLLFVISAAGIPAAGGASGIGSVGIRQAAAGKGDCRACRKCVCRDVSIAVSGIGRRRADCMPCLWTDRCRAVPADHCTGCVSCDDRGCFVPAGIKIQAIWIPTAVSQVAEANGQADRWFGCRRVSAARRLWYNRCSGRCRVRRDLRRIARRIVSDMACAARCDSYAAASARTVERFF